MRIPPSPYAAYTTGPAAPGGAPRPAQPAKPVAPPPALREVLTADERAWFTDADVTGPVCYGQQGQLETAPAPRLGRRLDVRA
jgi:hypothetical protein